MTHEADEDTVLDAEVLTDLTKPVITGEDVALIGVGSSGVLLIVLVGGVVAGNAVLISLLSVGGGSILWIKAPKTLGEIPVLSHGIKWFPMKGELKQRLLAYDWKAGLLRHELLFDILVSAGVIAMFGTTVTGLVAAGLTGLSVSVLLRLSSVAKRLTGAAESFKAQFA